MSYRIMLVGCLLLSLLASGAAAETEDVARYDLTLFGYRAGMSYDEAAAVRPFHRVTAVQASPDTRTDLLAEIDTIEIAGINCRFQLDFTADQLFKVVVRFSPLQFEELHQQLVKAFGAGDNRSRNIEQKNGVTASQTSYRWVFPGARIFLIGSSANTEFATASLHAIRSRHDPAGQE